MDITLYLANLNNLKKMRESFKHASVADNFEIAYRNMIDDRIINEQSFIIEELLRADKEIKICGIKNSKKQLIQ